MPDERDDANPARAGEMGDDSSGPLRPHPDVISRQMGGGAVLIHLGTNRIYETNETGGRIWGLLSAGSGRDEVVRRLLAEYDIDEPTLTAQFDEILGLLLSEGLLKRAGPAE